MEEQIRMLQNTLIEFFKENNVRVFTLNEIQYIDKQSALASIVGLCDAILKKGDINGTCFNLINYLKYVEANKVGFHLFENPTKIEMECEQQWSFASTTITTNYFGFDIETIKQNNKERFQKFINLIDSIEIGPGVEKNTIRVNFTVNDVWRE